ncbi:uncharacterized protein LOC144101942 [Amblyomma americanum]
MPPRGRGRGGSRGGGGHKGQRRHFTNLEELEREKEKEERNRQWRAQRGEGGDEESGSDKSGSESSSEEESSAEEAGDEKEEQAKAKGVEHLIEVQNPNRVERKPKKVAELQEKDLEEAPQLSRREREELEKQRARQHYQKMHAAGKTEEARADLARLALIRKQREEQARKKEEELKAKEAERKAKAESINKALGKKT